MTTFLSSGLDALDMEGQGEPLVLLNGWMRSRHDWAEPFLDVLTRHFTVVRVSVRGMDSTGSCRPDTTMADLARDCLCALDDMGITHASLLGHSLGGMIAQVMAWTEPDRFQRIVLAGTSPPRDGGVRLPLSKRPRPGTTGSDRSQVAATRRHLPVAAGPIPWDQPAALRVALVLLKAMLSHGDEGRLAEVRVPCLVLHGSRDTVIRPELGRRLAKVLPDGRFELVDGAGHDLVNERPLELAQRITSFLSEVSPRTSRMAPIGGCFERSMRARPGR